MRTEGKPVSPADIKRFEEMAEALSKRLLNTSPEDILEIKPLYEYRFIANNLFGDRTDIINKAMPR